LDLQNPLVIVRSIFTKTIGEYRILPPGEEAALKASIIPVNRGFTLGGNQIREQLETAFRFVA
jgi:hypothetical protein